MTTGKVAARLANPGRQPYAFATDAHGAIYVANAQPNEVVVFEPGSLRPARVIRLGSAQPQAVAIAPDGDVYVATQVPGAEGGKILAFGASGSRPIRALDQLAYALVLDPSGNLYAAGNEVRVYSPQSPVPLRTIRAGVHFASAMVLGASGTLYVANLSTTTKRGFISVYPAGATTPQRIIRDGARSVRSLALTHAGTLVALNQGFGGLSLYAAGASHPELRITAGISGAATMALSSNDTIFVTNPYESAYGKHGYVAVYPTGSSAPTRLLTSGLDQPFAMLATGS